MSYDDNYYKEKYLKYKSKYLNLKIELEGGDINCNPYAPALVKQYLEKLVDMFRETIIEIINRKHITKSQITSSQLKDILNECDKISKKIINLDENSYTTGLSVRNNIINYYKIIKKTETVDFDTLKTVLRNTILPLLNNINKNIDCTYPPRFTEGIFPSKIDLSLLPPNLSDIIP